MAEYVERSLENILSVFEQLQRIELFTPAEVKRVIKQCRSHEYQLLKKVKRSEDFVQYMDYLKNFLKLVRKRRKANDCWLKKVEIDYAITGKITGLYAVACDRFKNQISLWEDSIAFAKQIKKNTLVSKLYTKFLQVHGNKPHLWTIAAKWEFEENSSSENARALYQKALRLHPKSGELWREFFSFEIKYVEKLQLRREKLEQALAKKQDEGLTIEKTDLDAEMRDEVMELKLAELVFQEACETLKSCSELAEFWRIASSTAFGRKLLSGPIFQFLSHEFSTEPLLWQLKAEKAMLEYKEEQKALMAGISLDSTSGVKMQKEREMDAIGGKIYEEALETIPDSVEMWNYYLDFLVGQLDNCDALLDSRRHKLNKIFSKAHSVVKLPLLRYVKWMEVAKAISEQDFREACKAALEAFPQSSEIWLEFIRHEILTDYQTSSAPENKRILKLFNKAIKSVAQSRSLELWKLAISWTCLNLPERIEELFETAVTFPQNVSGPIKELYLELSFTNGSLESAREVFKRLSLLQPNSLELYLKYINMELADPRLCDALAVEEAFELALGDHGKQSVELWLRYLSFLFTSDTEKIPGVYNRAMRSLVESRVDDFVEKWTLMKARV